MNKWVETWRICIFPPFSPINKKVCFASGIHMHTACSCCSQEKEMKKVTIEIISVETNNAHFIFWQVKKRIETIKTAAQRIFLQCQLSFNACRYAANSLFRKKKQTRKEVLWMKWIANIWVRALIKIISFFVFRLNCAIRENESNINRHFTLSHTQIDWNDIFSVGEATFFFEYRQ